MDDRTCVEQRVDVKQLEGIWHHPSAFEPGRVLAKAVEGDSDCGRKIFGNRWRPSDCADIVAVRLCGSHELCR